MSIGIKCSVVNIGKSIVAANLDSNHEMFASGSALELCNFDSGLLVSPPLYASTKHDSFYIKRNLEKSVL